MPRYLQSPDDIDTDSSYIHCVYIEYGFKDDNVPAHDHPVGHWSMLVSGTVEYTVRGKVVVITGPNQVWIPKKVMHSMRCLSDKAIGVCIMPRNAVEAIK